MLLVVHLLKNISYSQMQVYDQCPHRWKLTYKDKIKVYKPSIHTVFGKAFHETVQDWLTTLYEVSGVAADAIDLENKLYEGLIFHYSDEKKNKFLFHLPEIFSNLDYVKEQLAQWHYSSGHLDE